MLGVCEWLYERVGEEVRDGVIDTDAVLEAVVEGELVPEAVLLADDVGVDVLVAVCVGVMVDVGVDDRVGVAVEVGVSVEDEETHSWIRVLVTVDCVDYMRDRHTLEVIKGEVGTTTGFRSVWVFVYQNQEWLLAGIEEGSTTLSWASAKNRIDTSYLDSVWNKKQKVGSAAKAPARKGTKSQAASRDSKTNQPTAQPKQRLIPKPTRDEDQ